MVLRSSLQMAVYGAIGAALSSLPLIACRGVGLILFKPEDIPGVLIGQLLGISGDSGEILTVVCYFGAGAISGILYRQAFKLIGTISWNYGMALGVAQWTLLGIGIAWLSPLLPNSPLLLPTDSPTQHLFGTFCLLLIFLVQILFGLFMGFSASAARTTQDGSQSGAISDSTPEKPAQQAA